MTNINLFEAVAFANRFSQRRGGPVCYELRECRGTVGVDFDCRGLKVTAETVYECTGYRLPTEAEWEYAARGGVATAFYSGDILPEPELGVCHRDPNLARVAWYCWNSGATARAVGQKAANPWGVRDMLGNATEWTTDVFSGLGYGKAPLVDPRGAWVTGRELLPKVLPTGRSALETGVVRRGGSFLLWGSACTANHRSYAPPYLTDSSVGFRLVRSL